MKLNPIIPLLWALSMVLMLSACVLCIGVIFGALATGWIAMALLCAGLVGSCVVWVDRVEYSGQHRVDSIEGKL